MEPLKLRIKNFYSISDGEIDFAKFSSALILGHYENNVLMSNGAGKSSIFEAICWVLFNETRQTKVDDVIRWTATEAFVEFEFLFGQHIYKISRRRSRVAKESSVSLFTKDGSKWINDSGSTNSETNKKISTLLKIDEKIFLNSVYFKQHDISLFANSSPSDRKEIIKSIMKLERWDEYQKHAKNKLKTVKEDIEKQLRVISENKDIAVEQAVNGKAIEVSNEQIIESSRQQKAIQDKLHSLLEFKKERNLNYLLGLLEDEKSKVLEFKSNGKRLQVKQGELNAMLDVATSKNNEYAQQLSALESDSLYINEQMGSLKKENLAYQELEDTIFSYRVDKSRLENTISDLDDTSDMVGVGQCQACLTDISEHNLPHIHANRQQKREESQSSLSDLIDKLNLIESEYKERKLNKEKNDALLAALEVNKNEAVKLQLQKKSVGDEVISLNNETTVIEASILSIINQIKTVKIDIEAIERKIAEQRINNIDVEISALEAQNKEVLAQINSKNVELGTLLREKEFLSQKYSLVNTANEMLAKLGKEKVSYDQLSRFFGKEGIQAVFIESVVDELEQYANTTLSYICNEPTVIKLRTQKKTGDSWQETLEIDVMMNGFPQTFESLGGGERFRISLALRIGLSEVLVKRAGGEIRVLLLDEVDSPLDTYGLNNLFENIIKGLEKRFKILVISHNDKLKDRFSDLITVNKTSTGSFITQS